MDTAALDRGWHEVTGLLSAPECELLLAECERIIADPNDRVHRDKPASGTQHLEELDQRIPLVAELLDRPELTSVVADWFGVDNAPAPMKVGLRSPGPGFGGQDLHRDAIEGPVLARPDAVTAIIALVEFTELNGATRFVPRSHQTNQPASQFRGRRSAPGEVVLTGPAGTAFVFNGHCLHAGGENRSQLHRPALQVAWSR